MNWQKSAERTWQRPACWAPAATGLLLLFACTVVSDFDVHECVSDEACAVTGSAIPHHCDAQRCVEGCRDNRHCASRDPRYPICQHRGGDCVALTSEQQECYAATEYDDATMGTFTAENLLILGAFAPTLRSSVWLTLELATRELAKARPAVAGTLPELIVVLCEDAPERVPGAMEHLVGNLGADAVFASFDDGILPMALSSARESTLLLSPNGAVAAPSAASPWYLGGNYDALVPIYTLLTRALAPTLQERASALDRASKIAVVVGPNEQMLAERVLSEVTIEGLTTEQLIQSDRLRVLHLSEEERDARTSELLAYGPDLVLMFAAGTFATPPRRERAALVGALEAAAATGTAPYPLYLISARRAGDAFLDAHAVTSPSFRERAIVLDLDFPGKEERRALDERYLLAFPNLLPTLRRQAAPVVYDAVYHLAYAAAAVSPPYDASRLREGLDRVTDPSAPVVSMANDDAGTFAGVIDLLRGDRSINLRGLTGPGLFDPAQRLRAAPVVVQCWSETGELLSLHEDAESTSLSDVCASEVLGGVE